MEHVAVSVLKLYVHQMKLKQHRDYVNSVVLTNTFQLTVRNVRKGRDAKETNIVIKWVIAKLVCLIRNSDLMVRDVTL